LIPGDLNAAWNLLTPDFQKGKAQGWNTYHDWWIRFSKVTVSNVVAQPSGAVEADVHYYNKNGSVSVEHASYKFVQDGGVWKIASSTG